MNHLLHQIKRYSTIQNGTVIIALVIAAGWVWGAVGTLQKNFNYQREVDELTQRIEIDKLENENLKFQQNYFKSSEYLELSARERLGKANPGEKLIILPDSSHIKDVAITTNAPTAAAKSEQGNLEQWVHFFFGNRESS